MDFFLAYLEKNFLRDGLFTSLERTILKLCQPQLLRRNHRSPFQIWVRSR